MRVGYVRRVRRVRVFARHHGFDLLTVIGAIVGALEVGFWDDELLEPGTAPWLAAPAVAVVTLALLGRRRMPFGAPVVVWLLGAAISFLDGQLVGITIVFSLAGLAAAFLLGTLPNESRSRAGLTVVLVAAAIIVYNDPDHAPSDYLFTPAMFAIAWLTGFALRERAALAEAAEARAAQAEREREENARRAGVRGAGADRARAARRRRAPREHDGRPGRCRPRCHRPRSPSRPRRR